MRFRHLWLCGMAAAVAAACGGGSDNPAGPSGGGNSGTIAATITITSSGVSSNNITVPVGSRVTFTNNDTRSHSMHSNPHPNHGDCPGLDDVGFLSPGQSRTSGNLNAARTCGFHDHDDPGDSRWQGTIRVQ
jgi:hypothetical protein